MARPIEPPRLTKGKTGYYYVNYHDGQRSRRETLATKDIEEAKSRFSYWLVAASTPDQQHKVTDLADLYEKEHLDGCADPARQIQRLNFVRQHFGELSPDEITPQVVAFYSKRRPVKAATIRGELAILKAALNHNVKAGRISGFPHIKLPDKGAPRDRWLSADEIARLADSLANSRAGKRLSRPERFTHIALEAAARKRSIETLPWERVDLKQGTIDFRDPEKIQTKKRQAIVPISDRLLPILVRAHEERTSRWVLDSTGSIRKSFETSLVKAGLPDVTPHVLRHTAATHMARNGVPLWHIAGILGNSVQMVEQTYAHHCPEGLRKAINYVRT
jgi:integrase